MPPPLPGTGLSAQRRDSPRSLALLDRDLQPNPGGKSLGVAYALLLVLGLLGIHQFYLGKHGRGVGYLLTFGWLTVGWWVDLFTLPSQVRRLNVEHELGLR